MWKSTEKAKQHGTNSQRQQQQQKHIQFEEREIGWKDRSRWHGFKNTLFFLRFQSSLSTCWCIFRVRISDSLIFLASFMHQPYRSEVLLTSLLSFDSIRAYKLTIKKSATDDISVLWLHSFIVVFMKIPLIRRYFLCVCVAMLFVPCASFLFLV